MSCNGMLHHAFEPSLFEPKSLLPGNGIFRPETNGPKRLRSRDETYSWDAANSGLVSENREILVRTGLAGLEPANKRLCACLSDAA
jgi:hypothetical protein